MVYSWGLIAGLTYADMLHMPPGLVCDLFIYRRQYDDQQHGITRRSGNDAEI